MKKVLLAICFASLSFHTVAETTTTCQKTDEASVASLFDKWNDSLKTGDAQKVSANYLSDAVLLPTVSNHVRLTDAERVDYFEHFLQKKTTRQN